jgi:hypothetical protein
MKKPGNWHLKSQSIVIMHSVCCVLSKTLSQCKALGSTPRTAGRKKEKGKKEAGSTAQEHSIMCSKLRALSLNPSTAKERQISLDIHSFGKKCILSEFTDRKVKLRKAKESTQVFCLFITKAGSLLVPGLESPVSLCSRHTCCIIDTSRATC